MMKVSIFGCQEMAGVTRQTCVEERIVNTLLLISKNITKCVNQEETQTNVICFK